MNAIPYDGPEEQWDSYEDEQDLELPGRPRRKVLSWWSAGLFALILCAAGFYGGVRVEKNQLASSSTTSPFAAAAAATGTGATGTGTGATGTRGAARTGATGASSTGARGAGAGTFRGLFGGGGAAGGATLGTVSSISGNSLYITETSGNTVKVTLSSATKVTKSVTVGKNAVRPGDLVTVAGAKGTNGTVSATTVNDTGSSPFGGASSGTGSSSSGSSGSSAVNSLFGGGG